MISRKNTLEDSINQRESVESFKEEQDEKTIIRTFSCPEHRLGMEEIISDRLIEYTFGNQIQREK